MLYEDYISNVFSKSPTNMTAIEELQEFKYNLHNKKDEKIFQEELENICIEKFICPICGNQLQIKSHKEYREFQGGDTYECISDSLKCTDESCGYIYNLND